MDIKQLLLVLATCYCVVGFTNAFEMKSLQFVVSIFSGELMDSRRNERSDGDTVSSAYIISKGHTDYSFIDFITYADQTYCLPYEYTDLAANHQSSRSYNLENPLIFGSSQKAPIRVQCIPGIGNGTMLIANSMKDIVYMLSPHGNTTKRTDKGNCAIVLFYSKTCPLSAQMGVRFNPIASQFPDFRVGAIDAIRYHVLNTEFGIVGLPQVMLFHQGRPLVRFMFEEASADPMVYLYTLGRLITAHTGIRPQIEAVTPVNQYSENHLNSLNETFNWDDYKTPFTGEYEEETDWCLWLAWSFIGVCACYYFTKTKWYASIVEVAKRNWRDSEAQHEHIQ